ncbi:N-acetylmuramoyl-L-alanine amidase [Caldalkalibacillus uzonensis]|uniref:N-acetylmuramoyl-L-alanine amidase n=1 Tax=Caldalkalibacillus uzonensis TaxID=353224 RepID=A0ABU0CUY2_9BACI|nr:N-acetylmuramoyl-L-alanine amidase CwlD [Caldalkalibacillus uzonensis]MDQ0340222.1 N-acetylmuramoyl-L-alanine amidase [Caldalkalibacillus uzonensis]
MKQKLVPIIVISLVMALGIYMLTDAIERGAKSALGLPLTGQIIIIDPGHGGRDGGASSRSGIVEKDVALAISIYLRDLLQQAGAFVIMTRDTDVDLASEEAHRLGRRKKEDLMNRVKLINQSQGDLYVSIHLNSITSPNWRGAQTFYNPLWEESERLARFVQDELIRNLENTNRHAKKNQDIYILKASQIPGTLVEVGFLSNPHEANLLSTAEYQKKVAFAIYEGILRYYSDENSLEFP